MKKEFSKKWKGSKQPRKQRKYIYNSPLHLRRKMMVSPLDKKLKEKHGLKRIEVRKNDEVKVMRGKMKGKQGKVIEISLARMKIAVENLNVAKKDGTKVNVWFHPSNVKIINLITDDRKRLKRRGGNEEKKDKGKVEEKKEESKTKSTGEKKNAPKKTSNA